MLSHELRNPLAPIRSAVHLLRALERPGSEDPAQRQAHEIIERQVANLTKLVSDLLEVSRVLSGRIRLDLQIIDLNEVLRQAVETVQPQIAQSKHSVTIHAYPQPVWAKADATRMEEVFVNILTNAIKYTPSDGSGRIDIWCIQIVDESQPSGHQVEVRIQDNGVGIDKELLPRIFDLFTQADRSLARSAGGLGIGLAIAQRLVELHGGTIEALSPPPSDERGTAIIIRLPLSPISPDLEAGHAATSGGQEPRTQRVGPQPSRVLVVDDNIDHVTMVASSLRYEGFSVQSAYNGLDGLRLAKQWRPDIAILDIGLPGLDGYELARRLRADPATKNIRLIALTGYGRETDIAQAYESGFDVHLTKPVEFKELRQMMSVPRP
jgi:CheY-like chemotaxis protein